MCEDRFTDNIQDLSLLEKSFSIAVEEVLSTMAGFSVEVQSKTSEETLSFDISGIMPVLGSINAAVSLSMSAGSARRIVSFMTGISEDDIVKEELYDGVAELVNMIAGSAKAQLSKTDYHFRLTSPLVVSGENLILIQKKNIKGLFKLYGDTDVKLLLRFYIL